MFKKKFKINVTVKYFTQSFVINFVVIIFENKICMFIHRKIITVNFPFINNDEQNCCFTTLDRKDHLNFLMLK